MVLAPEITEVLAGSRKWAVQQADCLDWLRALPDRALSMMLFSGPYESARTYGIGFRLKGERWVEWMRPVVVEACRATAGLVCVNMAGVVRKHRYSAAVEFLVADLLRHDGLVCGPSPYAWVRNGTPGSGNKKSGYHRRCWEPIYCFALPDRLPLAWHDQLAFGQPPKFGPGGAFSNRNTDGSRVNQWGGRTSSGRTRKKDGTMQKPGRPSHKFTSTRRRQGASHREVMTYTPPAVACPPNVIRTGNGGNQTGHPLAHEGEAPMNLALAERFVCWFCPPGGIVGDPFVGSGTTPHAAVLWGRRFVGCDVRESQVELTRRRVEGVTPVLFGGAGDEEPSRD